MSRSRLLAATALAAAVALVLSFASPRTLAQGITPSQLVLKKSKERGSTPSDPGPPESNASAGTTKEKRIVLCLESWDAQTHMTKREWKAACERSVRDFPAAFK